MASSYLENLERIFTKNYVIRGECYLYQFMADYVDNYTNKNFVFVSIHGSPLFISPTTKKTHKIIVNGDCLLQNVSSHDVGLLSTIFSLEKICDQLNGSYFPLALEGNLKGLKIYAIKKGYKEITDRFHEFFY